MKQPDLPLSTRLALIRSGIESERGTIFREDLAEVQDDQEELEALDELGDDPDEWGPSD